MSKTDSRPYFKVERYEAFGVARPQVKFRIVSIAGGDIVADNIPSADLAEAMRKAAEEARK